jgi:hypothetical protein
MDPFWSADVAVSDMETIKCIGNDSYFAAWNASKSLEQRLRA